MKGKKSHHRQDVTEPESEDFFDGGEQDWFTDVEGNGTTPYTCDSCGRDFKTKTALLSHQRNTHPELRPAIDGGFENALLKLIAPQGVPADSSLLRDIAAFLETARDLRDRLSRGSVRDE